MRLFWLHADSRTEVEVLYAGEIGGVVGMKMGTTGDTLCVENAQVELERIRFPEPVMFMAIEPKTRADRDKLGEALQALASEDPTCIIRTDEETGQTIVSGMGELHLDILKDRLFREFHVQANTGKPMVAYYETVTGGAAGDHVFDREIGGKRQFAHVRLEVRPRERGGGNHVEMAASGEGIFPEFRSAVMQGVEDGMATGVLARYPIVDTEVRVTGGRSERDASTDVAFRTAAVMAFRDAVAKAGATFLEPVMALEIATPAESLGEVMGDLNGRRGKVVEMTARGETQAVKARVPLAELFEYSTTIRSLSRGRATYTMEPEKFEVVPESVRAKLLDQ